MISISDWKGVAFYTGAAALAYQAIYRFISPSVSKKLVPHYSKLSKEQKLYWNCGSCSILNGLVVTTISAVALWEGNEDKLWGISNLYMVNGVVMLGYFISDLQIIAWNGKDAGGTKELLVHHVTSGLCCGTTMVYKALGYFATLRCLSEISQPFLQLRWCLSVCDKKDTAMYTMNGFALTGLFFASRILIQPIYYKDVYQSLQMESASRLPISLVALWLGSSMAMDALNIYWFGLLFRGAIRHLGKTKKKD